MHPPKMIKPLNTWRWLGEQSVPSWTYFSASFWVTFLWGIDLQKLADSPCYLLVIFVVHEAGRETRGKRAGVEATRTVIQQQKK
jgi:hypothetical protein